MKAQNTYNCLPVLCFLFYFFQFSAFIFSQGTWVAKAPLSGTGGPFAVAFTIGTKGYLGTGNMSDDFWEYDPTTDSWSQMANFGGGNRGLAVGFSIGSYGYIGTGIQPNGAICKDLWKYDPLGNSWTQMADLGGPARKWALGFSIAAKGYIGTGSNNTSVPVFFNDLWEYDPAGNTWTQKANYGGGYRCMINEAVFVINDKAYLGTGYGASTFYKDFWEYNPFVDTWTQKVDFPGTPRNSATGFSLGCMGYIGLGYNWQYPNAADFWKYNPLTNSWSTVTLFPGGAREGPIAFVIANKAYVGMGAEYVAGYYKDLWEYTPVGIATAVIAYSGNTICVGQSVTLSASGGSTYSWSNGNANTFIVVSPAATAAYYVIVSDSTACIGGSSDTAYVTITVNPYPSVNASNATLCQGQGATLSASGTANNYLWSTGANGASIAVSPNATATYTVIGSIWQCNDTATGIVTVYQKPDAGAGNDMAINCGGSAALEAAGEGMYYWSTGETSETILVSPAQTTLYTLTVTNANGCTDEDRVTVEVNSAAPYLPNAFSPNGDNENDFLQLYYGPSCVSSASVAIYNRLGEKVFQSNDKDFRWDGTYRGKPLDAGVFAYFLKVYLQNEDRGITLRGNVSLLR